MYLLKEENEISGERFDEKSSINSILGLKGYQK
jgi:hypothetical protein